MARIVVSGYMVRHPYAGNMAAFFHYVLGLHRLGHDVLYVEDKGWPYSSYDPLSQGLVDFPAEGLRRTRALFARHCPDVPVIFVDAENGIVDGARNAFLPDAFRSCDLFLDVGGMCWLDERQLAPRRALVDMDPLFTQVDGFGSRYLLDYDVHFTVGLNVGRDSCIVPTMGIDWIPSCPPVVLDLWRSAPAPAGAPATTVANWAAYEPLEIEGVRYGQKDVEFERLLDLPACSPIPLEVALSGDVAAVRGRFRTAGWSVIDGGDVTRTLEDYRDYIARSFAELSPAKHAYVATRSGWVSDRTACYLAAGRPAVVQDTGLPAELTADGGLLTFSNPGEALGALEAIASDPDLHARAAQRVAERHFAHDVVLPRLLERALRRTAVSL